MDNDGQNQNPEDSSAAQGIFSTPELTVDTEKLAQVAAENQKNEKSRVASIFANTETGKQAQRLNDAMGLNDSQPVDADVIIDNGPKKKSKLPLILAGIAILAAVAGLLIWTLIGSVDRNQANPETATEAFQSYSILLKNGPNGLVGGDNENWFIFTANRALDTSALQNYAIELENKYNTFYLTIKSDSAWTESAAYYDDLFKCILKNSTLSVIEEKLLNRYLDDGASSAVNYVSEVTSFSAEGDEYDFIRFSYESMQEYLLATLSMIEIYDSWGCIKQYTVDSICVQDRSEVSAAYSEVYKQQTVNLSYINDYMEILQPSFKEATEALAKTFGKD